MTQPFTLSRDQRDQFERVGVLRLDGLLDAESVRRARGVVLNRLAPTGLWKDGAWRLDAVPRPQWPDNGLRQPSKVIGNRHPEVAALIEDPALCATVDALMDGRAYAPIGRNRRPHLLFTLPNTETWRLPGGWHTDVPRLASSEAPGVQVFTFLETVEPRGGGTLVVAGSHRLMDEGRHIRPQNFPFHLRGEPFFDELFSTARSVMGRTGSLPAGAAAGMPQQVMELTGAPGDAWLLDLRVLHTTAPNAGPRPRVMVTYRYVRSDLSESRKPGAGARYGDPGPQVTTIQPTPPETQLQDDPRGFVTALLAAHGLPCGVLQRMEGWSNQVWVAEAHVVRISTGRLAGSLGYEARALRALGHAPCPRVVAAGNAGGREWMIQTRLAGVSLLTAWPGLTLQDREAAMRSLAAALRAVHGAPVRDDLAEPPWRAAALAPGGDASMAYRLPPARFQRVVEANLRARTAPPSMLEGAARFIESRLGLFAADEQVRTHGDVSFANVLWDGERAALVDFESCGLAPMDRELDLLLRFLGAPAEFSPEADASQAPMFSPVLPWLGDVYPQMFCHPDLIARLEVYDALWELVQLLNYPADHPRRTAHRLGRILTGDASWKAPVAALL